mmetsp:Transcript_50613/g.97909  ORF Transcript_50613/g.97909 Transcript_50613/m.97909 type:complete len:169 (+) Transcript_50613:385-891(+)
MPFFSTSIATKSVRTHARCVPMAAARLSSTAWSSNNVNNRDPRSIPKGDRLRNRVCIVTGAGTYIPGLGNAVVTDKKLERMKETLAMIKEHAGTEALAVQADLTLPEDCQRVVDATVAAHHTWMSWSTTLGVWARWAASKSSPRKDLSTPCPKTSPLCFSCRKKPCHT